MWKISSLTDKLLDSEHVAIHMYLVRELHRKCRSAILVENQSHDYAKFLAYLQRQAVLSFGVGVYFIIEMSEIIVQYDC
jgi:hypothetical protein